MSFLPSSRVDQEENPSNRSALVTSIETRSDKVKNPLTIEVLKEGHRWRTDIVKTWIVTNYSGSNVMHPVPNAVELRSESQTLRIDYNL